MFGVVILLVFLRFIMYISGADPGFQVMGGGGGAHLKKLRRAEGGANIFGVFRVKNHDFTPKILFFPIAEGGAKIFEVFRVKNHDFTTKNHIFSNFRGGGRRVRPPLPPPPLLDPPLHLTRNNSMNVCVLIQKTFNSSYCHCIFSPITRWCFKLFLIIELSIYRVVLNNELSKKMVVGLNGQFRYLNVYMKKDVI